MNWSTLRGRFSRFRGESQEVPTVLRWSLYAMLVGAGVVSVPFIGSYGPLPITVMLDVWVIAFILFCLFRGKMLAKVVLAVLGAYLLTRILPTVLTESPWDEFLRAYRWVLYLAAFVFAYGRKWGPVKPLIASVWCLLGLALIKAMLTLLILGPGQRPGLLLEDNFELALFSGLVAVVYSHMNRYRLVAVGLFGLLTLLTGSRSGGVAFLILAVYAITQTEATTRVTRAAKYLAVPVLAAIPISIFFVRAQATQLGIDRLRFLEVFLDETRGWSLLTWLFGTVPLTPLSEEGCARLSHYETLFYSLEHNVCYSVILHAFLLRVVFDAGIVGLLISVLVPLYLLHKSRTPILLTACVLLIAVSNGVSVSGLNNPYVALPILLALVLVTRRKPDARPEPHRGEDQLESASERASDSDNAVRAERQVADESGDR